MVMVWTTLIFTTSLKWVVWFSVFTAALSDTMKAPSLTNIFHYRIHMIIFFFHIFWVRRAGICLCLWLSFCLAVECTAYTAGWHIQNCLSHQLVKVNIPWTLQYPSTIHRFLFHLSAKGQQVIGLFTFYHSQCTMGDFFSTIIVMRKQHYGLKELHVKFSWLDFEEKQV